LSAPNPFDIAFGAWTTRALPNACAIAAERSRFGWRRINVMLQREGIELNHKKLRRIYRAEQLQVRARKKRHVRFVRGVKVANATRPNKRWPVDFLHDTPANCRQIRIMTLIDDFTREALALGPA